MEKDTKEFFQILGEIWRDISAIEFLMRCALAKKEGDIDKFPKPPYPKGKVYHQYPKSFSLYSFRNVTEEFNKNFPELAIPNELIELRDAMAHGLISQVNHNDVDELIKFKKQNGDLIVGFSMSLDLMRIRQIRQSVMEYRQYIMRKASDGDLK